MLVVFLVFFFEKKRRWEKPTVENLKICFNYFFSIKNMHCTLTNSIFFKVFINLRFLEDGEKRNRAYEKDLRTRWLLQE